MPQRSIDNLKTYGAVVAEEINRDAEFRAEWQRLALAREVAAELIRYRAKNRLSQRGLADRLGVSQPRVAKLESGEHNPTVDTLIEISRATGLEFAFDVAPANKKAKLVTKAVRDKQAAHAHGEVAHADGEVSVVAAAAG